MSKNITILLPSGQYISLEDLNILKSDILNILSNQNLKICDVKYILKETSQDIDMITDYKFLRKESQ